MQVRKVSLSLYVLIILAFVLSACGAIAQPPTATPASTNTAQPTATITLTPTNTPRPSPTLRPTKTPNLAATQRMEDFNSQTESFFEKGYLTTAAGEIKEIDDFAYDWAQLGWYNWLPLGENTSDFYLSAHMKWSSAYRSADTSGCGFIFAIQENGDHYAVFLDQSQILFLNSDQSSGYSRAVGLTRGTGRVQFDNPADSPQEADFTIIVNGTYTYVLVNDEVVGEYTLAKSKVLRGDVGLSLLSGTNKDYGTRCEMTDIRVWIPER